MPAHRGAPATAATGPRLGRRMVIAALTGGLMLLSACSGGSAGPGFTGDSGSEVSLRGCVAGTPLIPARVTDNCGQRILDAVTARLLRYDPKTGEPQLDIAESVETSDNQNFTVTLVPGYRFQDGTEVTSQSFVDAWSWAADPENDAEAANQFAIIDGADALAAGDESGARPSPAPTVSPTPTPKPTGEPAPPAPQTPGPQPSDTKTTDPQTPSGQRVKRPKTLRGLTIVDQRTFTIRTTQPVTDLEGTLAGTAFAPLPEGFFTGPEAVDRFGKLPVGAGPFSVAANTAKRVELHRFADYSGVTKPQVDRAVFRISDESGQVMDLTRAYNHVVNNELDVTEAMPTDRLYADQWMADLPDRHLRRDTQTLRQLTFAENDKQLDDVRIRRAISMAIDRSLVAKQIFNDTATPADSWVSPAVADHSGGACGNTCDYDPAAAHDLFRAAGGYEGPFNVTVSGGDGDKQWADAICNQLKNALQLDCQVRLAANQAELVGQARGNSLTGMVGQPQQVQRLSAREYLAGHSAGSSQNWTGYRAPEFEQALARAEMAEPDQVDEALQQAEQVLATDLPSVPAWTTATAIGWSNRVTDVEVTPLGNIDLTRIRVK